jgi:hypothetical protein
MPSLEIQLNNIGFASRLLPLAFFHLPSLDDMVNALAEDGDGAAGRGVTGGDEERTSPEPGTARRRRRRRQGKERRVLGAGGLRVEGAEARRS